MPDPCKMLNHIFRIYLFAYRVLASSYLSYLGGTAKYTTHYSYHEGSGNLLKCYNRIICSREVLVAASYLRLPGAGAMLSISAPRLVPGVPVVCLLVLFYSSARDCFGPSDHDLCSPVISDGFMQGRTRRVSPNQSALSKKSPPRKSCVVRKLVCSILTCHDIK